MPKHKGTTQQVAEMEDGVEKGGGIGPNKFAVWQFFPKVAIQSSMLFFTADQTPSHVSDNAIMTKSTRLRIRRHFFEY